MACFSAIPLSLSLSLSLSLLDDDIAGNKVTLLSVLLCEIDRRREGKRRKEKRTNDRV